MENDLFEAELITGSARLYLRAKEPYEQEFLQNLHKQIAQRGGRISSRFIHTFWGETLELAQSPGA